jgi:hypothetical protein
MGTREYSHTSHIFDYYGGYPTERHRHRRRRRKASW